MPEKTKVVMTDHQRRVARIDADGDVIIQITGGSAWTSGERGYRARVEADGRVSVWDPIAEHYTQANALTPRQEARLRKISSSMRRR